MASQACKALFNLTGYNSDSMTATECIFYQIVAKTMLYLTTLYRFTRKISNDSARIKIAKMTTKHLPKTSTVHFDRP